MKYLILLCLGLSVLAYADQTEELLTKATQYIQTGAYDMAQLTLEKLGLEHPRAQDLLCELWMLTGNYTKALEAADRLAQNDATSILGKCRAGEILMLMGKYPEAEKQFLTAYDQKSDSIQTQYNLGSYYLAIGNRAKYLEHLGNIFDNYDPGNTYSSEELVCIAQACRTYAMRSDETERSDTLKTIVQDILPKAIAQDKYYFPAYQTMAEIFLDAFNTIDAKTTIEEAIKLNPNHPWMLCVHGLFQAQQYELRPKAMETIQHALKINPKLNPALNLAAAICISDEEYTAAQKYLQEALANNPMDVESRSLQAAIYYMQNRETAYQEECKKVLAINPEYGSLYATVASMIGHKRQFSVGVELNRKAIELDPFLWTAYIELGMSLMRVGNIEEAEKYFQKVRQEYNFHTQTHNMLLLLQKYKEFKVYRTENFIIRIHISEAEAFHPIIADVLEQAFAKLSKTFKFVPETPILFEMFPSHDDFSVRTIGLDSLGASGACFGKVVVAVSPKSKKLGYFNWASVAWHELAHVFTLNLSNYQVPRWFTEGLSEYTEFQRNPACQRKHDAHLYAAYSAGYMRNMATLNVGFTRPQYDIEIAICYYQAGLICQYIDQTYGFDSLIQMLQLYKQGKSDAEVFSIALHCTLSEFDERFGKWLQEKVFQRVNVFPAISSKEFEELKLKDSDEIVQSAEIYQKLALGYFQQRKFADAEIYAAQIIKLSPKQSIAYDILGQIAFHNGKAKKARETLEKAVSLGSQNFDTNTMLGILYLQEKKINEAIKAFERAKAAYPNYVGSNTPYQLLAKIYKDQGQKDKAIQELETYVHLEGNDFKTRMILIKEYIAMKKYRRAAELVVEARDIVPLDADLQKLVEQIPSEFQIWKTKTKAEETTNPGEQKPGGEQATGQKPAKPGDEQATGQKPATDQPTGGPSTADKPTSDQPDQATASGDEPGQATPATGGKSNLSIEIYDSEDPVPVGSQTIYVISILNTGDDVEEDIVLAAEHSRNLELIRVRAPMTYEAKANRIQFKKISLEPSQKIVVMISCRALRLEAGKSQEHAFLHMFLKSPTISTPVKKTEPTNIYKE